jgi:tripartite-type tricarboxylate transporter receptor subunit TctC
VFNQALVDKVVRQKMTELGFIAVGGKPQAYAAVVAAEIAKWRKVIKDSNIPPPS